MKAHITFSFMIQMRVTSTHKHGSLEESARNALDLKMGTFTTAGHLLGQKSFLAEERADAVMFVLESSAL